MNASGGAIRITYDDPLPDADAPTVSINSIAEGREGTTVKLSAAIGAGGTRDGAVEYAWSVSGGALDDASLAEPTLTRPQVSSASDFTADLTITVRGTGTNAKDGTSDTASASQRTFRVTDTPPALTAPNFADDTGDPVTWTKDEAITAIVVPAATGNPAPTYAAVGALPDGITFDPATREIEGTPTATGSGTITIRATNSQGSDDWTLSYETEEAVEPDANLFTGTIGNPGTSFSVFLRWEVRVAIPGEFFEDGNPGELEEIQLLASSRRTSFRVVGTRDLTQRWEKFNPALIIQAGNVRVELPGPDNDTVASRDATEPYTWSLAAGDNRIANFITAFRALPESTRRATTFTLQDGEPPGLPQITFTSGRPRMSAQLAKRVDIPAEFRSGRPSLTAIVEDPIIASFRTGFPRIEARVVSGIVASFRTGRPRLTAIPEAPIAVSFRSGRPIFSVLIPADIEVSFRTGRPRFTVEPQSRFVLSLPPIGPYEWAAGTPVALILPAATFGGGNPAIVYTVERLPTGLDFDSARRRIHGTPLRALSGTVVYGVRAQGWESDTSSGDYSVTGDADTPGRSTGPFDLPQLPRDIWVRMQDPGKLRGTEGERGVERQRLAQQLGTYHQRLQTGFNDFSERAAPKPTGEARDARMVPALSADGSTYELLRLDRVFLPFYNSEKDIAQSVLQSAAAAIDPRGVAKAEGDVVLIVDAHADAVWGVRTLGRRSAHDIPAAVLRSANANIDPQGAAYDPSDGAILIADANAAAIWGFLNGARHSTRDVPASLLRVANATIRLSGVAIGSDGDLFALDADGPAAWAVRGGALIAEKHVEASVMRQANATIDPQGIVVDDAGDQLILDAQAVAVWGMRNGARHSAKDIASSVLRAASADIDPSGMAVDEDADLLVLDRQADAVWGISPYRKVG